LSKSDKEDLKETYGFENPNKTPEERQAEFWQYISQAMDFLQRCTDRFPAPFYTDDGGTISQANLGSEYSQLELFRIFLESKEQYADAMNCHIIQGAIDIAKSQMDADAFTEISGRLQKKLEDQRLAKEWTPEDTLAEKKRLIRQGMDEKEAESEAEFSRYTEEWAREEEEKYPASIMNWALDLYKNRFEKFREAIGQDTVILEEEIEVGDTVDKEQSVDEMLKPHSQEYFGDIHKRLREFILRLYDGKIIWAELGREEIIHEQIKEMRNRQKKSLYNMADESDLGYATLGQLVAILRNTETAKKAKQKGISEYESVVDHAKVVLSCRNNMDHDERKELPPAYKIANAGLCSILNEFFDKLKYR
jgi:hypothetical protein